MLRRRSGRSCSRRPPSWPVRKRSTSLGRLSSIFFSLAILSVISSVILYLALSGLRGRQQGKTGVYIRK